MRLALVVFVAAMGCGGSTAPSAPTDGDAGPDAQTSADASPLPACTGTSACMHQLVWGWSGGLTFYDDESFLSPCTTYARTRTYNFDAGAPVTCTQTLPDCVQGGIGAAQIDALIAAPDVANAIAHAPVLYGYDSRPSDGAVLQISVDSAVIDVGLACDGRAPCTDIPAGVKALADALVALDAQETSKGDCGQAFHGK